MKTERYVLLLVFLTAIFASSAADATQISEPTVYLVKKGDTLWGLSDRFMKDPFYWPNLWAKNPDDIKNPHFIYPGQKLRVYPDRIEIEAVNKQAESSVPGTAVQTGTTQPAKEPEQSEKAVEERRFTVSGGEGFIAGGEFKPSGFVIAGQHNRRMFAADDVIYTDIGRKQGGKVGNRYNAFKKFGAISHPVTNQIIGYRVVPLGGLQLTEMAEKSSKGLVTESFLEIEPGAALLPYKNRKKEVTLKAPEVDLTGYIVETRSGIQAIAAGDIAYIDLGERQGVKVGNIFYVVREVKVEINYFSAADYDLPVDVLGALLVVETAENTATVLVIKSIDSIYKGDRIEMKKGQ
jgi:LysM repeat protein